MSRPGYRASGQDRAQHQLSTEEVGYDDGAAPSLPTDSQISQPTSGGRRRYRCPSPPPSSIIAWAWYVNGVRKPAETSAWQRGWPTPAKASSGSGLKDPKDEDLMALASQFDLHPLAIEDAAHGHTRSKLEMFGDDLFMVISTVAYVEHEELTDTSEVVATGQVMVFLGEHFVITVRRGEHAQLSSLRRTHGSRPDPAGTRALRGAVRDRRQDHRRLPRSCR